MSTAAFSQGTSFGLGVSAVGQFPSGDFENTAQFGYGGIGAIEAGRDTYTLTASSGYIRYLKHQGYSIDLIPVMAGIKASIQDRMAYLAGEAGAVLRSTRYSGSGIPVREGRSRNVGWNVGVGSVSGSYDLRFSFHVWDVRHTRESMSVGLSIGFTTWSP